MLLNIGSANAKKISTYANEVLTNEKVLHSSEDNDLGISHYLTVNYKKRVRICKVTFSGATSLSNMCYADN